MVTKPGLARSSHSLWLFTALAGATALSLGVYLGVAWSNTFELDDYWHAGLVKHLGWWRTQI